MFRVFALLCFAVAAVMPAQASVTHKVKFGQGPVVLVWQDGQAVGQGETVVLDAEDAAAPANAVMGGGALFPIAFSDNADDARVVETFALASNAPVRIALDGMPLSGKVTLRVIEVGSAASYSGPSEVQIDFSLAADTELAFIPHKTAKHAGSATDQALIFEIQRTGAAVDQSIIIEAMDAR